jgi:hypothetical protein
MTAVVQIHVDHLKDVLAVPVQAIVQVGAETWVYSMKRGSPERRAVQLGVTNDRFVQMRGGLNFGDQVVLNPSAIADSTQAQRETPEEKERETAEPPADNTKPLDKAPAAADGLS